MGLRGTLPDTIRFRVQQGMEVPEGRTVTCIAYLADEIVGTLAVDVDGMIAAVDVESEFRRRGIATAMLEHLRRQGFDPQHDWNSQFADGRSWATAVDPEQWQLELQRQSRPEKRGLSGPPLLREIDCAPAPLQPSLADEIALLRAELAEAAQAEYDQWDQDEDGLDPELGSGGICDRIAEALSSVICERIADVEPGEYGFDGDEHAALVMRRSEQEVYVDIPPGVYERGGGYSWRKLSDVVFQPSDIVIESLEPRHEI